MTAEHASPYLFVSYASADQERVLPLVDRLEAAGVHTWVDREGIHGGANYAQVINDAIKGAAALALMASPASLASRNVRQELALGWRYETPYLPLLLDSVEIPDELAYWLEGSQWIELLDRPVQDWLGDVVRALEALGLSVQLQPETAAAARRPRPLLVGREREQGILRQQLDRLLAGQGGVVLVGGEAGIGKSTLVEDLSAQAEDAGALVLWGHAYDLSVTPPYGPWLEIFAAYQPPVQGLPPLPAFVGSAEELAKVGSQERLFAVVVAFFQAVAAQRPLVLVLDDLHWADEASLDLFRVLARQVAGHRLLLVADYRSDELRRGHPLHSLLPLLVREAGAERLEVRPLRAIDYRTLIQVRYALPDDDRARLERYLAARAEGNPLYAGEVLRTLEEEGVLVQRDGAWRLGDLEQARVPTLLRQIIEGRVGRFDEESRVLLSVAAVVGQTVPLGVWAAAGEVDEDALLELAERAEEARLLEATPEGAGVRFPHALLREALYEGIPTIRRRRLHRRVGELLAAGATPDPDMVADHFIRAADSRAADWLVKAGERAEQAYDWQAAVKRLEQAIGIMEGDPQRRREVAQLLYQMGDLDRYGDPARSVSYLDRSARLARESGDDALALMAEFSRAFKRCYLGDFRDGLDDAARVLQRIDLAHQAPEPLPDAIARFEARHGIDGIWGVYAQWLAHVGRLAEAMRCLDEHVDLAAATEGFAATWDAVGIAGALCGDPARADQALTNCLAAFESRHDYFRLAAQTSYAQILFLIPYRAEHVDERRRLAEIAEAAWARVAGVLGTAPPLEVTQFPALLLDGFWERARVGATAARGVHVIWRHIADSVLVTLMAYRGEGDAADPLIQELLPEGPATEPGNCLFLSGSHLQRLAAKLALDAHDLPMARAWLEAHDRWLEWSGAVLGQADGQLGWAAYHHAGGDRDASRRHAEQALALATDPRQPLALIAVHRFLGQLDSEERRYADAEAHLQQSLALADACAAPFERALTLLELAGLRAVQDKPDEARALLQEIRAICEPLGAKPTLERVAALEQQLVGGGR